MATSPSTILFFAHPKTPVFFQSAVNTYYLCPDCLRSREARYCSGRTVISHEMCEVHRDLLEPKPNSNGTSFNLDDLVYFRKALQDGTLKNDFKFRQAYLKAQEKTSRQRPNHIRRRAAGSPPSRPPPLLNTGDGHDDENTVSTDTQASGSASHRFNHSHNSPESSKWAHDTQRPSRAVSTASSSPTSTVATASQSSSNVSDPSIIAVHEKVSMTFPSPRITYAHDPLTHCLSSPHPHFLLLPPSLLHALITAKLHRLRELRTQYDLCWGQDGDLKVEHGRLLEEVKVGRIGTAVFFKRCNGEWVNGIGEGLGQYVKEIGGITGDVGMMRGWDGMKLNARTAALEAKETRRAVSEEKSKDRASSSSNSNSNSPTESVSMSPSASISSSISTSSTSPTSSTSSTSSPSPSTSESESFPAEEPDKNRFEFETAERHEATDQHKATDRREDNHPSPQAAIAKSKLKLKIPLSLLQARESLVHQRITTQEDLILTCWAMNT